MKKNEALVLMRFSLNCESRVTSTLSNADDGCVLDGNITGYMHFLIFPSEAALSRGFWSWLSQKPRRRGFPMFLKPGKCHKPCKHGDIRDSEGLHNIFFTKCMQTTPVCRSLQSKMNELRRTGDVWSAGWLLRWSWRTSCTECNSWNSFTNRF